LSQRLAQIEGISPLSVDPRSTAHSYHIYLFRYLQDAFAGLPRAQFVQALLAEGIPCFSGYSHPLYRNPMFVNKDFYPRGCPLTCGHYDHDVDFTKYAELCPISERACATEAVWLEHRLLLGTEQDVDDIAKAVEKIRANVGDLLASEPVASA
jgi:hypothetical protein